VQISTGATRPFIATGVSGERGRRTWSVFKITECFFCGRYIAYFGAYFGRVQALRHHYSLQDRENAIGAPGPAKPGARRSRGGEQMDVHALTMLRIQLAYIVLGTVFVFFGFACCVIAAIRKRTEVRVLIWLGFWSGMYGTSMLLRMPAVTDALPHWIDICAPFTINAIRYFLIVAAMLVWSELTLGKMKLFAQFMAVLGTAIALAGIGWFIFKGWDNKLLPYNNLLAVCGLFSLTAVVVVPQLSNRFLAFPNRILTISTLVFMADALFRNMSGWLRLPRIDLPLLDELVFAAFLFSFAYVAGQKVFANERRLLSIESELEIARQIQASILPAETPEVNDLQIAACYLPMTAVGGDFYDFVQVDKHRVGFLVADVSGHGIPAALIASMIKVAMQSVVPCAHEPAEVLRLLNRILSGQLRGQLISAAYLWLDTEARRALYSSAGHPPLLLWRGGNLERIESNGLLFGVSPDLDCPVCKMDLNKGDRFLLYTDGVVEPENAAGDAFGGNELERVVRNNASQPPSELSDRLLSAVRQWQPSSVTQQDDITLIVIDVVG
jgi:sigma-B regulation protein RsbU (phosphoserine phosphatase)